jgi:Peptidase A4 family
MITPPAITAPAAPSAAIDTGNWAGYEWNGGSTADAQFTVPVLTPTAAEESGNAILALWDGLGAPGDTHIAQAGIYDYWDGSHIRWATFCAWWPDTDQSCGPNEGVSAGDEIFVRVTRQGLSYTMTLRDAGPHNAWVVTVKDAAFPALSTAEVIAEDTSYGTLEPLGPYSDIPVETSGNPATEVYSTDAGYAVKTGTRSFTIKR